VGISAAKTIPQQYSAMTFAENKSSGISKVQSTNNICRKQITTNQQGAAHR
jgi:hypothetical protein